MMIINLNSYFIFNAVPFPKKRFNPKNDVLPTKSPLYTWYKYGESVSGWHVCNFEIRCPMFTVYFGFGNEYFGSNIKILIREEVHFHFVLNLINWW